jgi:hypothetical protein
VDLKTFKNKMDLDKLKREASLLELNSEVKFIPPSKSKLAVVAVEMTQSQSDPALAKVNKADLKPDSPNKFLRFLGAFFIVLVTSLSCFILVKSSIDWVKEKIN